MSTPSSLSMRNPSNSRGATNPLDPRTAAESVYNKLELDKLKSTEFDSSQPSPFFPTDKYNYHVGVNQPVFDKIKNRLLEFYPQILLGEHIVNNWERVKELSKDKFLPVIAQRNTLKGIDFIVEDRNKLLYAIRNATADKKAAFAEGTNNDWKKHWALTLSFLATDGIGFREIFRPRYNDRPLESYASLPFDTRLGKDITIDVSSLHIAIAEFAALNQTRCNIHIDQLTVTLGGLGNDVGISPTAISHIVNELLFKTKLEGKLPDWIIDAFDISLLNPYEGFLNAGLRATIVNKPNFKWTIGYSVGLNNNTNLEWSGNFKLEHSVGTGISVRF